MLAASVASVGVATPVILPATFKVPSPPNVNDLSPPPLLATSTTSPVALPLSIVEPCNHKLSV